MNPANNRRRITSLALGLATGTASFLLYQEAMQSPSKSTRAAELLKPERSSVRQAPLREELRRRFNAYLGDRSRKQMVLLEEVVSAYLRADARECLALLHSLNAGALVDSPHSSLDAALSVDLDDLPGVLKIASEADGRASDALIKEAFRRKAETDPAAAFRLLDSLPQYLRDALATDLAKSWAWQDGAAAARAFYDDEHLHWVSQLEDVINIWAGAWGQGDPQAALKFARASGDPNGVWSRESATHIFNIVRSKSPEEASRLAKEYPDRAIAATYTLAEFDHANPRQAMEQAQSLPSLNARIEALGGIAAGLLQDENYAMLLEAQSRFPTSENRLNGIRRTAIQLAKNSQDPYSVADGQQDRYQHAATVGGLTEGLYQSKGMDGFIGAVQHGISAHDPEWLEAACSLILSPKAMPVKGGTTPPDWSALPDDVKTALTNYVAAHRSGDEALAFKKKVQ